jgi:cobalt-zinc-cadmium efflux system membrane fusion protein
MKTLSKISLLGLVGMVGMVGLLALSACKPFAGKAGGHDGHDGHEHEAHGAHGEPGEPKRGVHDDHGADRQDGHAEHEEGVVVLSEAAAANAAIKTAAVVRKVLLNEIDATGQVDFDQDRVAHVAPRLSGRVQAVLSRLGRDVKRGERLATVESIDLGKAKAEYLRAKSRDGLTEKNQLRIDALFADRIVPQQQVFEAQAAHEEAHSALLSSRQALSLYGLSKEEISTIRYDDPRAALYSVRAPIAGRIVDKHVTRGELVTPERNLFTVADLSRLWVWIDVYARDISQVHVGDGARIFSDAWPEQVFEGKVTYLRDQVDPDTRTIRARVVVDNSEGRLRPKMFVRVRLTDPHGDDSKTARSATLAVPEGALLRAGGGFVVFVQEGPRRYKRRVVDVGRRSGGDAEIRSGLVEGDIVAVTGVFVLKSEAAKEEMGGGHSH